MLVGIQILLLSCVGATRLILLEFHHPSPDFKPFRGDSALTDLALKQHDSFHRWVNSRQDLSNSVRRAEGYPALTNLFSGIVISVDEHIDSGILKEWGDVKKVYDVVCPFSAGHCILTNLRCPQKPIKAPTPVIRKTLTSKEFDAASVLHKKRDQYSNSLTGVEEYTGSTGKGVTLCTIDTGVDYTHPALGGCKKIGPGCRVAFGHDFAGDSWNASSGMAPIPDDDPMDCNGHGTHVAGIIMAKATNTSLVQAVGIAPDVTFGAYKAFGCEDDTNSALIIAAMDRAYKDNCTLVNLSVGVSDSAYSPESLASDLLAAYGMIVVAAAGNNGDSGAYRIASPGIAAGVTAVGSVENVLSFGTSFSIVGDSHGRQMEYAAQGIPTGIYSETVIKASTPLSFKDSADGCEPYLPQYFLGFTALIRRGSCYFATKLRNAVNAGAVSVIFYNNDMTDTPLEAFPNKTEIPIYTISASDGRYLVNTLMKNGNGNVTIVFNANMSLFSVPGGGDISWYSSWGLGDLWQIKPDIVAPGGLIYSTYLNNTYAILSGTSMASPHTAAIYALALSYNASSILNALQPINILSLLQTTANPVQLDPATGPTTYATIAQQGSGLINIVNATRATSLIVPSVLETKVTPWSNTTTTGFPQSVTFNVTLFNFDTLKRVYRFSYVECAYAAVGDANAPVLFSPVQTDLYTRVGLPSGRISVAANDTLTFSVEIRGPSRKGMHSLLGNSSAWLYGGWVFVTDDLGRRYSLAFGGTVGDFGNLSAIDSTTYPPFLSTLSNPGPSNLTGPLNVTFASVTQLKATLLDPKIPLVQDAILINLHTLLPSPATTAYVFPASVDISAALTEISETLVQMYVNTTQSYANTQLLAQFEAAIDGKSFQNTPPSAVAMSPSLQMPISDYDSNKNNLYNTIPWDGSSNFNGQSPFVASGLFYLVVVVESVYGEFSPLSTVVSDPFNVVRGS
ncbi:peptidase S8/S53 domain-containing protein [Chytriomyces sp. MP71]|nr:peptidase S8/S53 domain-containing protein [Chytriomyces sp. MP71]